MRIPEQYFGGRGITFSYSTILKMKQGGWLKQYAVLDQIRETKMEEINLKFKNREENIGLTCH